ncbi:ankyrin repeat domain-containing protein [Orientia tsutsugamushi]|uniref:Ankyrin repeat-containing protein 16 n=1 Tax=Orientia tsutsugamushi TaxID=784 RepID=A0A2U3R326_ORITS|nr:ankyrin repeat domain-containing protein [Orientia tsutsugamushi]KJV54510.1 ankyrin repeat family protein [Orientia tsutsugamushi str. Kato PP]SPR07611.1 ankyrin repeat-containing protein 16 [Orientia tsutsugamushi]SPR13594.1 ankyrin repeat-containing protein 16 [Orientia tsutsugamushi]
MNNNDLLLEFRHASAEGNVERVKQILAQYNAGDIINALYGIGFDLHEAIRNDDINLVRLMLDSGADPNEQSVYGATPLHVAIWYNRVDIIYLLLDKNANINAQNKDGRTPLHVAACHGMNGIIMQILPNSVANINLQDDGGKTLLHFAARTGSKDLVEFLCNRNADINITGKNTVVHSAAKNGHKDMVQFWLDRYPNMINLNLQDNDGNTALHLVAKHRFTILPHDIHTPNHIGADDYDKRFIDVAEMLLNRGVDTNIQNNDGNTALHLALLSYSGLLDITHLMMDNLDSFLCRSIDLIKSLCKNNNVNFILKNNDSYTVLDLALAIEHDQHKIAEHLQEKRLLWRTEQIKAANNSLVIIAENKEQILKLKPDSEKTDADKFLEKWRELPINITEQILDTLQDNYLGTFQQLNEERKVALGEDSIHEMI